MKNRKALLGLTIIITVFVINSCKKDNQTNITSLLSYGNWELASIKVTYFTGNDIDSTKKLDTTCTLKQTFTFNSNGSCTYTNFDCVSQTSQPANWSLTSNQLYLQANVSCTAQNKVISDLTGNQPFSYAQINTLGQFSMVLITGDVAPNYSLKKPRKQITYGFIRRTGN